MTNIKEHINEASCCDHPQNIETSSWKVYIPTGISLILLLIGIAIDHYIPNLFLEGYTRLAWYLIAYLVVGYPVLKEALVSILKKDFFNEFSLMSIATIGAFAIGEYPEGVAVMLFYSIGELFQSSAVNKAKSNIKALLDIRPDSATVIRNGSHLILPPEKVAIGEVILVKVGEKVSLDGVMLSPKSSFNTSALTGESKPKTIREGESVLAGMVNIDHVIEIKVEKGYSDSSLAKILEMVQDATARKSKTELLMRRFARIYTPTVFFLALLVVIIPYFIVPNYEFNTWLYRALVFLVISCPCALVISIPLGYFGGIGAASRNGILFKGANYLDIMTKVNAVVMDKTGTLTEGVFDVQKVHSTIYEKDIFVSLIAALESHSNHPIAKAITNYSNNSYKEFLVKDVKEISGYGLEGCVENKKILAGNTKFMSTNGIFYDKDIDSIVDTIVAVAIDGEYCGYITIADKEKEDAAIAIKELHELGIKNTVVLSGDKTSITQKLAQNLGVGSAYGDLLPEDKVKHIELLKSDASNVIAFVGDGINDAPSLALSDVGIAMGGMGSDAAIEVADVVIQTDHPSKIATAIKIAKSTKQIVLQNIVLAFGVKIIVLILGAGGLATMWEAVFADVGVALLAILNSIRIMKKKF